MRSFLFILTRFFRYALLFVIVPLAAVLLAFQAMSRGIARRARHPAMGASLVIKGWARLQAKLFEGLRKLLARYVRRYHPKAYEMLNALFR